MSGWYAQYVNGDVTRLLRRREAEDLAACSDVTGDADTALEFTDRDPGVRGGKRHFRIVPISDAQAARWAATGELGQ